jgi:hypothetical protein
MVAQGDRIATLRPPQRPRPRRLRHDPRNRRRTASCCRETAEAGRARLEPGRRGSCWWRKASPPTRAGSGWSMSRPGEDLLTAEGGEPPATTGAVFGGWQRRLRQHDRLGIPSPARIDVATGVQTPLTAHSMGRGRPRPLQGRPHDRFRDQRRRRLRAALLDTATAERDGPEARPGQRVIGAIEWHPAGASSPSRSRPRAPPPTLLPRRDDGKWTAGRRARRAASTAAASRSRSSSLEELDGRTISAGCTSRPRGHRPRPVIVNIHGGPRANTSRDSWPLELLP